MSSLHPETYKSLRKGHPWITRDKFSEKIKPKPLLQEFFDSSKKSLGYFLIDKDHLKVIGRFWSKTKTTDLRSEIKKRVSKSSQKRLSKFVTRGSFYLVFGEADQLPGLFIQKFNSLYFIQYQTKFWKEHLKAICEALELDVNDSVYVQERVLGEKKLPPSFFSGKKLSGDEYISNELSLKFKLKLALNHDIGWYLDMSSIRFQIEGHFKNKKNLLNLFSYTGAFSLKGLESSLEVTSVDVSKNYMNWLEENISINQLEDGHESLVMNCEKALDKLQKDQRRFDLIICDPPSFSSNGKKRKTAMDFYKENSKTMFDLLSAGGIGIFFINTHKITPKSFKEKMSSFLSKKATVIEYLGLAGDCPTLNFFPEGDYLKGLIFRKVL